MEYLKAPKDPATGQGTDDINVIIAAAHRVDGPVHVMPKRAKASTVIIAGSAVHLGTAALVASATNLREDMYRFVNGTYPSNHKGLNRV